MRAKEFINEAWNGKSHGSPKKVRDRASDALPGVYVQRQLRNTDTYMQYRMGLALAAARADANGDIEFSQESAWAENFISGMFVPEDEETIMLASKLMGVNPTQITDQKSREPDSTQKVSPVAKPKRNKYGV
jgi:ATP-dependent phosphoenolpyruvate carboxykinase